MRTRGRQDGFGIVEMLVSVTILLLAMSGLATLLIQNARINKSQQMAADVQANARNCLSMIVQRLRSAGWDPTDNGFAPVVLDPNLLDNISQIEVFADLDEPADGDTDDDDEQILIRHINNQIEWRRTSDVTDPFEVLAINISNDQDGNGVPEPMFVPDANPPNVITVLITAQSPVVDPVTRDFIRYTVSSDVVLRKTL